MKVKIDKETIVWMVICLAAIVAMFLFGGCKTASKIEKEYIHDTTRVVDVRYDSVDRWHTHYEYVMGDTVMMRDTFFCDRWHLRTDTVERSVVEYKDKEVVRVEERKVYVWWPFAVITALFMAGAGYISLKIKNK